MNNKICEVKLHKPYYAKGFFNIKKEFSKFLGSEDRFGIVVLLGDKSNNEILGTVDRTANKTGTPRVRIGQEFSLWTAANFHLNDIMIVEFLSKSKIRLYK
ncbi:MAG: hypothetical protein L3J53_07365 [Proteobacteria bacterium]|nr:hypothetical protein [Pseudomonadota bacterium]